MLEEYIYEFFKHSRFVFLLLLVGLLFGSSNFAYFATESKKKNNSNTENLLKMVHGESKTTVEGQS